MEKILRLHWSVHFVPGIILAVLSNIMINGYFELRLVSFGLAVTHWLLYPMAVHSEVQLRIGKRTEFADTFFQINWLSAWIALMLLNIDLYIDEKNSEKYTGLEALFATCAAVAFCYVFVFTARTLKTAEKVAPVSMGESLGTAILLAFYPFNFLFIHKRVQKVLDKPIVR